MAPVRFGPRQIRDKVDYRTTGQPGPAGPLLGNFSLGPARAILGPGPLLGN